MLRLYVAIMHLSIGVMPAALQLRVHGEFLRLTLGPAKVAKPPAVTRRIRNL
jgi:hypothetical protein